MSLTCPVCRRQLPVTEEAYGTTGKCRRCGTVLHIGSEGTVTQARRSTGSAAPAGRGAAAGATTASERGMLVPPRRLWPVWVHWLIAAVPAAACGLLLGFDVARPAERELQTAQNDARDARQRAETVDKTVGDLNRRTSSLRSDLSVVRGELTSLQGRIKALDKQVAAEKKAVAQWQSAAQAAQADLKTSQEQVAKVRGSEELWQKKAKISQAAVRSLAERLRASKANLAAARQKLTRGPATAVAKTPGRETPTSRTAPRIAVRPTGTPTTGSTALPPEALQVGDRFVTVKDVLWAAKSSLERMAAETRSIAELRQKAMGIIDSWTDYCIERSLVLAEADRELTDHQKKQIQARVDRREAELISQLGGSTRRLDQQLEKEGRTRKEMRDRERQNITMAAYLRGKGRPTRQYTRRELWEEYSGNRGSYNRDKTVLLRVMVVPFGAFGPKADAAARKEARDAIEQAAGEVRDGENFGEVARGLFLHMQKRYGEKRGPIWRHLPGSTHLKAMADKDGLWRNISLAGIKDSSLRAAAGKLEKGQVSGVVESDERNRFYLVKIERLWPAVTNFEQAQKQVLSNLDLRDFLRWRGQYVKKLVENHKRVHGPVPPTDRRKFILRAVRRVLRG